MNKTVKIRTGLHGLRIAKLEEDIVPSMTADGEASAPKYGEIIKLPNVQNFDLTARTQSQDIDSDDATDIISKCSGYDGKAQRTMFTPSEQSMVLGETMLADGTVVSHSDDEPPEFAIGFVCPMAGGEYFAAWILRAKFSLGDLTAETAGTNKLNPQSDTLSFTSMERKCDKAFRLYGTFSDEKEALSFLTLDRLQKLYEKKTESETAGSGTVKE